MNFFYATEISGSTIVLSSDESHHCTHVLRMRQGDEGVVVDGQGNMYFCTLTEANKKACMMKIHRKVSVEPHPYYLHLAIACLKNHDRMEWLVEKATEVGVDEITFLSTRYTERKQVNFDRISKIAISAMKQSQKAILPKIYPQVVPFGQFMIQYQSLSQNFIAHCYSHIPGRVPLAQVCRPKQTVLCTIGPEGDFSEEEVGTALEKNFVPVSLGESRLRSETAALAVCFTLAVINEMSHG
jgi:16S rRNA (uracil1498-N3)-methyltransferase